MKKVAKQIAKTPNGAVIEYIDHAELHRTANVQRLLERAHQIFANGSLEAPEDETMMFKALHATAYTIERLRRRGRTTMARRRRLAILHQRILEFLVNQNIGLVYDMRKRSRVADVDPDDLSSDGLWTLFRAVASFDPWRGFRFSTYACTSILRGFLLLAQRRRRRVDQLSRLRDDSLEESRRPSPGLDIDTQLRIERLRQMLHDNAARLTPMEQFVIDQRLLHEPAQRPETLESIGKLFRLSKERVRQIQVGALDKLRSAFTGTADASADEYPDLDGALRPVENHDIANRLSSLLN